MSPAVSILIPTRGRAGYLDVALSSIAPQAGSLSAETIVVCDGVDAATAEVAARHRARLIMLPERRGSNAARNAGVAAAGGDLLVFVDDDVQASGGWLQALIDGARSNPGHDAFGGPIRARLEGGGPHACGREAAPITTLDLGGVDRDATLVWSANMAVRAGAFARVGAFDETISGRGEEEDWLRRLAATGGRVRYLAAAGLEHRRTTADASLVALSRAAYALGRTARRYDVRKGTSPPLIGELRVLLGCAWHIVRRRCAIGIVMLAQSAGRVREWASPQRPPLPGPPDDFLSGTSGQVTGVRATGRAVAADALADARELLRLQGPRLRRAAAATPPRRVLVLSIERPGEPGLLDEARRELEHSRHHVRVAVLSAGDRGKFENLNALLADHPSRDYDWLLVLDDDVRLPAGFLDRFLFLAERFGFKIAQPAHRAFSHAAWDVTRRHAGDVARQTAYVEIGPVTAFHASTFEVLLPFPPLRAGWGLDAHWSALARERDWPIGVIDATAVTHRLRPIAAAYDRGAAIAEGRAFLAERPYTPAGEARRTLVAHRRW